MTTAEHRGAATAHGRKYRRPTAYEHRRSFGYFNRKLLDAPSAPFTPRILRRNFRQAVGTIVWPRIEETAGTKHKADKLEHVAQILAAALAAAQAGKVLACPRGRHDLRTKMFDELVWHGFLTKATGSKRRRRATVYGLREQVSRLLAAFATWMQIHDPLRERPIVMKDECKKELAKLPNGTPQYIRLWAHLIEKLNNFNLNEHEWAHPENGGLTRVSAQSTT